MTSFDELVDTAERDRFVSACLQDELYRGIFSRGDYSQDNLVDRLKSAFTLNRVMNDTGGEYDQDIQRFCRLFGFRDWPHNRL